jgi:hypothetical protein
MNLRNRKFLTLLFYKGKGDFLNKRLISSRFKFYPDSVGVIPAFVIADGPGLPAFRRALVQDGELGWWIGPEKIA